MWVACRTPGCPSSASGTRPVTSRCPGRRRLRRLGPAPRATPRRSGAPPSGSGHSFPETRLGRLRPGAQDQRRFRGRRSGTWPRRHRNALRGRRPLRSGMHRGAPAQPSGPHRCHHHQRDRLARHPGRAGGYWPPSAVRGRGCRRWPKRSGRTSHWAQVVETVQRRPVNPRQALDSACGTVGVGGVLWTRSSYPPGSARRAVDSHLPADACGGCAGRSEIEGNRMCRGGVSGAAMRSTSRETAFSPISRAGTSAAVNGGWKTSAQALAATPVLDGPRGRRTRPGPGGGSACRPPVPVPLPPRGTVQRGRTVPETHPIPAPAQSAPRRDGLCHTRLLRWCPLRPPRHGPALFSVGLIDPKCPPSTVYVAFNHYAGRTGP